MAAAAPGDASDIMMAHPLALQLRNLGFTGPAQAPVNGASPAVAAAADGAAAAGTAEPG
jgi:hypothetical protein